MTICGCNLETKGSSSVTDMPCAEKFTSLLMHSQKRLDVLGRDYKTDSISFYMGIISYQQEGKLYLS